MDTKSDDKTAAKEIIKILKTFFEENKHILLTAPPGHGKTWVINRIYDIFEFQKLFDKHKEEILQLKEELKQGTFEDTFRETFDLLEQDEENSIDDDIKSIVNSYFRILRSIEGSHESLYEYIVKYLEGYMSSKIPNHFNHGAIKIAPTGVAASNIHGITYHSFFSLNIFSNSTRQVISNADSRIIQYLQNINGYGIADLLYGIPDGQKKIIKDNDNLFRIIYQEIIIFDEISMIYDLSLDLLWKLTHDLQGVVRKIHDHFVNIEEEHNDDIIQQKRIQKKIFYTGLKKDIHETKRNYAETMISMDGLNLMFHIVDFFFGIVREKSKTYDKMTRKKFKLKFDTLIEIIREKKTYDKMIEKINDRKEKMKDRYNERVRCYLENLCLEMGYEIFCKQFQKMKLEVPHEIKLFYDIMRSCNNNYKFISNMEKNGSIKSIKFLFVGDFLQIQPFENTERDSKFKPNKIAKYYLEIKSVADKTIALYKDINSYFANIFAESDNIEKLTLTVCQRQKKDESGFRKLISAMRLGKNLSTRFQKLLESRIINYSVDRLLTEYIDDKNNFTILSMCNSYTDYINNSLILRDHKGDINLVINTLLEKNVIPYEEREQNIYLNNFISVEDIEKKIIQLCYITYFLKSSSIRNSFHITLDEKQIDFLEDFRDKLKSFITDFLRTNTNGSSIYNYRLPNLYRILIDRWYEVERYNGEIKYKYKIEEKLKKNRKIDKIILTISLDDKYKVLTLKSNRNDLIKNIEDKIENILSKINPDLESDHKKFLDDTKDRRQIECEHTINEKLKKITLAFYLDEERKILTSMDNLNDLRKSIEDKIENILSKINPDLVFACTKFLDDIKDKRKDILSKINPDLESDCKKFLNDIEDKIENVLSKNINLSLESDRKKFLDDIEYKIENILSKNNNPDLVSVCKKFLDDIEDKIENVLSKINPDLESDYKKFLDDIEDDRKITYDYEITEEKLKKIGLTFYLDEEHEVRTSIDNLNDFRRDIEDKIEDILTNNIKPDLESACKKFLDDIKDNIIGRRRSVTLHKLKMKLKYHDETMYGKPIESKIILPISENEAIMIHESPIKKVILNRGTSNESSNISIFVEDMKCMITKNKRSYKSDTGFLYVNGSMGNFEEIDNYGRLILKLKDRDSLVDVSPVIEHQFRNFFHLRFPIVPAYSISINKSQGLTIPDKVILNFNQKKRMWRRSPWYKGWFFNLVVAISRCTKLENLIINRYIDQDPNERKDEIIRIINNLQDYEFVDYMFNDMYRKAERTDPKSKLIFDIEKNKKRCQSVLKEIYDLRKRRKLNE